jgi:hypothetical protein
VYVRPAAVCGNWEDLERVCRFKGDVRHTAECENFEELKLYADAKGMTKTLLREETGKD